MANYGTILTAVGERLIAEHLMEGGKLELAELAVGDGGGSAYTPDAGMTALRGERWRGALNSVKLSERDANVIVVDALVPVDVGGFTIREVGVFDAAGNLIGVMNTPAIEKLAGVDGATTEQYIQMLLAVSSAEGIELNVDPSLVLATREDVERLFGEIGGKLDEHNEDKGAHEGIREVLAEHIGETNNPHEVVASQIKLTSGESVQTAVTNIRLETGELSAAIGTAVSAHNTTSNSHADLRSQLSEKANLSDLTVGLATKANQADLTAGLATKANQSDLTAGLATKANQSDLTTGLASKANLSSSVNATLSSSWSGSGPYTQTATVSGITTSKNFVFDLSASASDAQDEAFTEARIRVTAQGTNSVTFRAMGDRPKVSIPITVVILG